MAWECVEGVTCGKCGEKGHLQRNCKNVSCHKCGRKGHIAKFCNDPFAKAAEVERNERQQALLSARAPGLSFPAVGEKSFVLMARETAPTVVHKDTRGPWDGLGVNLWDTGLAEKERGSDITPGSRSEHAAVIAPLINSRKRVGSASVQTVVSQRLKIVDAKPGDSSQKTVASAGVSRTVKSSSPFEVESTGPQWEGLVDYGSEDSEDHLDHNPCKSPC